MLEGPDMEGLSALARTPGVSLLYSGGIGELSDLERLARLELASLTGVIVGKALYERRFTVAQANAALAAR